MKPTLYHNAMSTCSQKVRLALAEKRIEFDSVTLDLRRGDQMAPDYREKNPLGVVPTLGWNDEFVIESTVINEFIDDAFTGPALRPHDPVERARMRLWTKQLDEGVHGAIGVLSVGIAFRHQFLAKPKAELDEYMAKIDNPMRIAFLNMVLEKGYHHDGFPPAVRRLDQLLADMEAQLARTPWLAGSEFSLADIGFVPYLVRLEHLAFTEWWRDKPKVSDWLERARARPSFEAAMTAWYSDDYLTLMQEKGEAAWPDACKHIRTSA